MRTILISLLALGSSPALAGLEPEPSGKDADGDGVGNAADLCPGSDDSVDLDGNGTADCAETFVSDAGFDAAGSTAQWVHAGQTVGWSSDDGSAYAQSGSMPLDIGPGAVPSWELHGDCLSVDPSTWHILLAQWDLSAPGGATDAWFMVWEYADAACTSVVTIRTVEHLTAPTAGFETVGGDFVTKPSTRAVHVAIFNRAPGTGQDPVQLRVDNILLHDSPAALEDEDETGEE